METWNDIRHADILAPTEDSASVPMNDFSDVPSLSTNNFILKFQAPLFSTINADRGAFVPLQKGGFI